MQNNEAEIIRISRQLTPENRTQLLTWINLAFFAENSAGKKLGINAENYQCNGFTDWRLPDTLRQWIF